MAFCSFQDDVSLPFASHRVLCGGVTYQSSDHSGHLGSSSSSSGFSHSSSSALFGFLLLMVFPPMCHKTLVLRNPYITLSVVKAA